MAFDWREYLSLAQFLQGQGRGKGYSQEAIFRCGVSRAYYAAFCHARNYACNFLGYTPTYQSDDHRRLRAHLRKRRKGNIAFRLDKLRQFRNQCDYDDVVSHVNKMLQEAVTKAQYVLSKLI